MTEYITTITAPEHGGPEVYTSESAPKPTPDDGQLLVRLTVSGVNYLDVSQRTGATPLQAPFAAGVEGVGVVEGTGDGVSRFAVGQRVGWMAGGQGSFSDYVLVDQMKAVGLPDSIEDEVAAASLMQALPPTISPPIRTPSPKRRRGDPRRSRRPRAALNADRETQRCHRYRHDLK